MADEGVDSGSSYRWRLARAAAASCALHMLLFGGLSVSRLDLDLAAPESLASPEPKKPKRPAADFRLQVPRSAATQRPAHERPLELPVTPPATEPAEPRQRPTERTLAAREQKPAEEQPAVTPSAARIEPTRRRDTAATPADRESPSRQADASPAEVSAAADRAAAAPAVDETAVAAAAPAALAARPRPEAARVAARWRPREVALLERLTARAPEAASLAARAAPAAAPAASGRPAIDRRSTADARSASATQAEAVAAPATIAAAATPAVSPAARDVTRRASSRSAPSRTAATDVPDVARDRPRIDIPSAAAATAARSARQADAAGDSSAAAASRSAPARQQTAGLGGVGSTRAEMLEAAALTAESDGAGTGGEQLAPAASALATTGGGRRGPRGSALPSGRQTAAAAEGEPSGAAAVGSPMTGGSGLAAVGSLRGAERDRGGDGAGSDGIPQARRPLGRDAGGTSAAAHDVGTAAALAPAAGAAATPRGPGDTEARLGPALIDRGRRGTAGRSALTATRGLPGGGASAAEGDGEGLSVSPADIAALGAGGRQRAGLPELAEGPRSPERIAASALPSDGRVRDVAAAFAGRAPADGGQAGGIADMRDLERARAMVDRGLEFLVRSQRPDGRWRLGEFAGVTKTDVPRLESETAATGLALLCFFGAGHDHFDGPYRDPVRRGLEFLLSVQKPDGDLFVPADDLSNSCGWLYSHGIAAIAVCEAVGMTGDPRIKPAAERACRFIAETRHPTLGGWRYLPRTDADLSVSGWMLVALRAGDLAGVKTDPAALDGVRTLLAASAAAGDPTRYAYNARKADQRRTDLSVACMTAVGTLMRLHTGAAADDPGVAAAARVLAATEPAYGTAARKVRDAYLWYYASQVLVHTGGEPWQGWYDSLVATLEPEQHREGPLAGSWDAAGPTPDRWGEYGGRVYVTALHLLTLEVPWRHLPTYATAPAR